MNKIKIINTTLSLISGLLLIGYGGMDDSPGAQGIGLLTIISSLAITTSSILKKYQKKWQ